MKGIFNICFHTLIFMMITHVQVQACSMYKITVNGRTMVGNNEDSWRETSGIWFEKGKQENYSVAYVGYSDKPDPDGAVNEWGLVFDGFTMHARKPVTAWDPDKEDFSYAHIKTIMQRCKTVDEVYTFLSKMNLHMLGGSPIFNGGMLLFVDRNGKYLVVEVDHLTLGNDPQFLLANFSIANTKDLSTVKIDRYCKGVKFLENHGAEAGIGFCTALSDTMSVNRSKVGDGTLYTSIYDLDSGLIHVYFFHDYSKRFTFNIAHELSLEDHQYEFASLFSGNEGYKRFIQFQTPHNNTIMACFVIGCGILFFFSFLFFCFGFIRSLKTKARLGYLKGFFAVWNLAWSYYMYVLMRNQSVFYFPSPYKDGQSILITLSSYLPFVLVIAILPLIFSGVKILRQKIWKGFETFLLLTNTLAYVVLLCLFVYWKMLNVF